MEITSTEIQIVTNNEKLLAHCTITIDYVFVVHDIKIIAGPNGNFVAMPSRKITAKCPRCGTKNHLLANYCNNCGNGIKQKIDRENGRLSQEVDLFADIAHPIDRATRIKISEIILADYNKTICELGIKV